MHAYSVCTRARVRGCQIYMGQHYKSIYTMTCSSRWRRPRAGAARHPPARARPRFPSLPIHLARAALGSRSRCNRPRATSMPSSRTSGSSARLLGGAPARHIRPSSPRTVARNHEPSIGERHAHDQAEQKLSERMSLRRLLPASASGNIWGGLFEANEQARRDGSQGSHKGRGGVLARNLGCGSRA